MFQKGSPLAGFSACGGTLLRKSPLLLHGSPRGVFLSQDTLSYGIKRDRELFGGSFRSIRRGM